MDMDEDMKFEIKVEELENEIEVFLVGGIGREASIEMFQGVKRLMEQYPDKNVRLNFEGVEFLDSSGVGTLVAVNSTLLRNGKELVLTAVPKNIMDLLRITNLLKILKVV